MAITISQQPQTWTPAFNDQWITALSDEIAQPDFKYKVDVSIDYDLDGVPTTATFIDYVLPRPDGYLVYNAKEKVQNYVQNFFKPFDYTIVEAVNERVEVTIDITETWTGEITPATDQVIYFAWNACLTEKQMYSFNTVDYISSSFYIRVHSVATSGLLSLPFERQTFNSDVYLHFVKPSALDSINYKLIDTNGIDILNDIDLTGSMTTDQIYQINISPQFAEETWGGVTVGMFIQVDFLNVTNDSLYTYTYEIKELCSKHDINRVYYRNRRGGVSSFPFEQMSTDSIEGKTNEVRLNRNKIVSGVFTYNPYDHENRIVSTQEIYKKSLMTNWITETDNRYLEELYSSPQVWVVNENDGYSQNVYDIVPVTSKSAPFLLQKHSNNKLFNYKIDVELSTQETRQRT